MELQESSRGEELDGRTSLRGEEGDEAEEMKRMLTNMQNRLRILENNTEAGAFPATCANCVTSSIASQDGGGRGTADTRREGTESSLELEINLYYAAKDGRVNDVRNALASGANINAVVFYGFSPLLIAVWKERVDAAQYLLERGADPDARNAWTSESSLHYATGDGNAVLVALLLRHGAGVDARNGMGRTPLHKAVARGYEDCVSLLLDAGADPSVEDNVGEKPTDVCVTRFIAEMLRVKQCNTFLTKWK